MTRLGRTFVALLAGVVLMAGCGGGSGTQTVTVDVAAFCQKWNGINAGNQNVRIPRNFEAGKTILAAVNISFASDMRATIPVAPPEIRPNIRAGADYLERQAQAIEGAKNPQELAQVGQQFKAGLPDSVERPVRDYVQQHCNAAVNNPTSSPPTTTQTTTTVQSYSERIGAVCSRYSTQVVADKDGIPTVHGAPSNADLSQQASGAQRLGADLKTAAQALEQVPGSDAQARAWINLLSSAAEEFSASGHLLDVVLSSPSQTGQDIAQAINGMATGFNALTRATHAVHQSGYPSDCAF